jgi:hypothetical protein
LENRSDNEHQTTLQMRGLPDGTYSVSASNKSLPDFVVQNAETKSIQLPISATGNDVVISRR